MTIELLAAQWGEFRRALRAEDRVFFDGLLFKARQHASAATYAARLDPVESLFLAMLLEHEREGAMLRRALEELRRRLEALESVAGRSEGDAPRLDP